MGGYRHFLGGYRVFEGKDAPKQSIPFLDSITDPFLDCLPSVYPTEFVCNLFALVCSSLLLFVVFIPALF